MESVRLGHLNKLLYSQVSILELYPSNIFPFFFVCFISYRLRGERKLLNLEFWNSKTILLNSKKTLKKITNSECLVLGNAETYLISGGISVGKIELIKN